MKKKILVLALASTLAACSNPASNSAGVDQGSSGAIDSAVQWSKKLVRGFTAHANLQIPASAAIADALLDHQFLPDMIDGCMVRSAAPYMQKVGGISKVGPGVDTTNRPELVGSENPYLLPVAAILAPYRGWQLNLIGGFGDKAATQQEKQDYLQLQEASVDYTNALFTRIATRLNNDIGVLEDPASAKKEIQKIYKSIPKSELKALWAEAVKNAEARGGRIIDMSGTQGVDWSADGNSYSGNADGLTWTKAGVPWFGKGAISGKQWTIGLESSVSKSLDKSTGGSESVGGSTGEKTSGGAQPK